MPSFTTSDIFIFLRYSTNSFSEPNSATCVSPVTLFFRVTFFLAPCPNTPSKLKGSFPIPFLVILTFTFVRASCVPESFSPVFPSSGVACTGSSPIFSLTSRAGSSLSVASSVFSSTVFSCVLSFSTSFFCSSEAVFSSALFSSDFGSRPSTSDTIACIASSLLASSISLL